MISTLWCDYNIKIPTKKATSELCDLVPYLEILFGVRKQLLVIQIAYQKLIIGL
jgi:hypothetical protein